MAISSDGSFVIYSAGEDKPQATPQLYLRRSGELEAKPIAGTEGGVSPFLSPNDRQVGFSKEGKLWKISINGGVPVPLCNSGNWGASWGSDNTIVFSNFEDSGLFKVSAAGGKREVLTTPDPKRQESGHRLPFCLPNGKGVLFTVVKHPWDLRPRVAILEYKTGKWNVLLEDASDARYAPSGHLVFLRQGDLWVVPFDENRLKNIGEPGPVFPNIIMHALNHNDSLHDTGAGQFSISSSGILVYAAGSIGHEYQNSLMWVDLKGSMETAVAEKKYYGFCRLSPDGNKIAYSVWGRDRGTWVYDIPRRNHIPLSERDRGSSPIWWDNERVVFSGTPEAFNLFWRAWDRSSDIQQLRTSEFDQRPISWHPDRKTLALIEAHPGTSWDIYTLNVANGRLTPQLKSKYVEEHPEFSPDGRFLAYTSNETGVREVWIRSFAGPSIQRQISTAGGISPVWAPDGKRLYYWNRASMWFVDIRRDEGLEISIPQKLFNNLPAVYTGAPTRSYDLSPDGKRFLMVKVEDLPPTPVTEMILVQNWLAELKQKAPTGK